MENSCVRSYSGRVPRPLCQMQGESGRRPSVVAVLPVDIWISYVRSKRCTFPRDEPPPSPRPAFRPRVLRGGKAAIR